MKKLFCSLIMVLGMVAAVSAQKSGRIIIPEAYLKFKANSDYTEVTITGVEDSFDNYCYANQGKWLELPSKIQGVPVTRIGNEAFSYKGSSSYKNGLWIPDCVKEIGHGAFYNSEFYAIHLPEGLEEIPGAYDGYEGCFYSCEAVNINIPSSVKWIGDGAFQYCSVEELSIPAGCIIGKAALASCKIKKLMFPKGRIYLTDSIYKYGRDVYSEGYGGGNRISVVATTLRQSLHRRSLIYFMTEAQKHTHLQILSRKIKLTSPSPFKSSSNQ